jgi:hypothetical protein
MGCQGSKADSSKAAEAPAKWPALEESTEKTAVPAGIVTFSVLLDGLGAGGCFAPIPFNNAELLEIVEVTSGPFGEWNSRGDAEKVRTGDFVAKVRTVDAEWITSDAFKMLECLFTKGPFELEIQRMEAAPVKEEAPVEGTQATDATPVEARAEPAAEATAKEAPPA